MQSINGLSQNPYIPQPRYDVQNTASIDQNENIKRMQEAYANIDVKQLTNSYLSHFQARADSNSSSNFLSQVSAFNGSAKFNDIFGAQNKSINSLNDILSGVDFKSIGYEGKPITQLSQSEASDLVSENGFFGIANTADRISNFIISAAGDDLQKLEAGKEGMLRGFKEAEKIWGGKLPEISQKTIEKATQAVDKRIAELGGNVLSVQA
ncbi:hydrogenase-4 component G [Campylobacter showae]|uniref:hydrogenase-4 component G n=1 Tax=Campylobacter showae TaxID=204 RepID=UPI000F0865F7|nr:hydrogenase-4 component G [Campylobacter showae]